MLPKSGKPECFKFGIENFKFARNVVKNLAWLIFSDVLGQANQSWLNFAKVPARKT
jgi:hypothetical protein